jgi:HK97 family phage major capsid protein
MTKEAYTKKRNALTDEAQSLINDGKLEDFEAKKGEIEALDNQYDNEAKAQANLNALMNTKTAVTPLENAAVKTIEGGKIVDVLDVTKSNEPVDMFDSTEYKNAFMKNVLNGAAIPAKFMNADANTATTDVGTVIPTTTMQKIIEKMEATGMILPLVTHTSYKGGLAIPTSTVKPVATWVSEGATSDKQKKTTGSIVFSYYKLRCAISMSLEVSTVTYPMFEAQFVQNVADAMVKAKEQAIVSGTGTGQPKGILAETPVTGQALTLTEGTAVAYADLIACEAALPQAYDNGAVWCMTKKTFVSQVLGMVDSNKQPIARVNYGITGKPEYSILGRRVVLVGDYMSSWTSSVTADTIVAFLFNFSDYVLNTNLNITVKRYEDNDTDDQILKAIELVDGKVVDKNSLVTLTITNAA